LNRFGAIHRAVFPAGELLLGMGLAQALASLQVHLSNLRLLSEMAAVAAAGFQPVPNLHVMPLLAGMAAAFGGGVYFTLSVGAGLSILTAAAGALAADGSSRRGRTLAAAALLWIAALSAINANGFNLWASLYIVVIPPPVFALAWGCLHREQPAWKPLLLTRVLPVALLALGWSTQYDPHLFTDLRDHLLISNPAGERVNSFYYRYTLYPAEAFKSRRQKQLNAVRIAAGPDDSHRMPVAQALIRNDWLPVAAAAALVIVIDAEEGRLRFSENGRQLADASIERFLAGPRAVLDQVSDLSDRWGLFGPSLSGACCWHSRSLSTCWPSLCCDWRWGLLPRRVAPILPQRRSACWRASASWPHSPPAARRRPARTALPRPWHPAAGRNRRPPCERSTRPELISARFPAGGTFRPPRSRRSDIGSAKPWPAAAAPRRPPH
jgi:hypothetical protein